MLKGNLWNWIWPTFVWILGIDPMSLGFEVSIFSIAYYFTDPLVPIFCVAFVFLRKISLLFFSPSFFLSLLLFVFFPLFSSLCAFIFLCLYMWICRCTYPCSCLWRLRLHMSLFFYILLPWNRFSPVLDSWCCDYRCVQPVWLFSKCWDLTQVLPHACKINTLSISSTLCIFFSCCYNQIPGKSNLGEESFTWRHGCRKCLYCGSVNVRLLITVEGRGNAGA